MSLDVDVDRVAGPVTGDYEPLWADIPEWVGYYQISNRAQVRSVARDIKQRNGRTYRHRARILKPYLDRRSGLLRVCLTRDCKRVRAAVYPEVLVREMFS